MECTHFSHKTQLCRLCVSLCTKIVVIQWFFNQKRESIWKAITFLRYYRKRSMFLCDSVMSLCMALSYIEQKNYFHSYVMSILAVSTVVWHWQVIHIHLFKGRGPDISSQWLLKTRYSFVVVFRAHLFVNSRVSVEEELKTLSCLSIVNNNKVLAIRERQSTAQVESPHKT